MWPADSGRTAPGSMIGRRGGTGEAVSGASRKSLDDAGDPSSRPRRGGSSARGLASMESAAPIVRSPIAPPRSVLEVALVSGRNSTGSGERREG
jgi:hypothetical protein